MTPSIWKAIRGGRSAAGRTQWRMPGSAVGRTQRIFPHSTIGWTRHMVVGAAIGAALCLGGCSQPLGLGGGGYQQPETPPPPGEAGLQGGRNVLNHRAGDTTPAVLSGLKVVSVGKWDLRVDTGSCTIGAKQVAVTQPTRLTETPVPTQEVHNEEVTPGDDPPRSFDHGTRLKGLISDTTTLPDALDPASVTVWSAAKEPRRAYQINVDYLLDPKWGEIARKPGGGIPAGQAVFVDYKVRQLRLDTIEVRSDGTVVLKKGEPARTAPAPAAVDPDSLAIATVFLDYGTDHLTPDAIYPVGAPYADPTVDDRKLMAAAVAKTRAKLQASTPVTIVFWGDSVTAGGSASAPTRRFPDLVEQALRTEFKGSKMTVVNAGVGGSNIDGRLPGLEKDVLSHHPDLVIVEFVNDMGLPAAVVRKDYTEAVQQLKKAGSEVILTTPHFTMPEMMGLKSLRGKDPRPDVAVIREVARAQNVGLADVSRRWEHLAEEGIPYTALLYNGINHPDDRGHAIYARTLESFF